MGTLKKYKLDLMKYHDKSLPFIKDEDTNEWVYLLDDILNFVEDLSSYNARHIIAAMFYILTNDKEYDPDAEEAYYRFMRVYTKQEEIRVLAFSMVSLLMDKEEKVLKEYEQSLRTFLTNNGYDTLLNAKNNFDADKMKQLLLQPINKEEITLVEQWFFGGHLYILDDAINLAYTTLHIVPNAYHLLIFLMDKLLDHSINEKNIELLEIFIKSFELVHKEELLHQSMSLEEPSDLREYCFALSSIAMYYTEKEDFIKAINCYEKLFKIDKKNLFHAKEYSLRAYMMHGSYEEYTNILEKLDNHSVYKRFLIMYRKIQLMEEDLDQYMHELLKDNRYLLTILLKQDEEELEQLPEIEEDFIREYGLLFLENDRILEYIKTFIDKYDYTA